MGGRCSCSRWTARVGTGYPSGLPTWRNVHDHRAIAATPGRRPQICNMLFYNPLQDNRGLMGPIFSSGTLIAYSISSACGSPKGSPAIDVRDMSAGVRRKGVVRTRSPDEPDRSRGLVNGSGSPATSERGPGFFSLRLITHSLARIPSFDHLGRGFHNPAREWSAQWRGSGCCGRTSG